MNCKLAQVTANPPSTKLLCYCCGRTGAAEKIRNQVGLPRRGFDYSLQEFFRLLCWIVESFVGQVVNTANAVPKRTKRHSRHLIEVLLVPRRTICRINYPSITF